MGDKRLVKLMGDDGTEVDDDASFTVAMSDYMLANSRMKKNKLYDMVTLNDAVPIVLALVEAVKAADADGRCIEMKTNDRIKNLAEDRNTLGVDTCGPPVNCYWPQMKT